MRVIFGVVLALLTLLPMTSQAQHCEPVAKGVSLCDIPQGWKRAEMPDATYLQTYEINEQSRVSIGLKNVGFNQGLSYRVVGQNLLDNIARLNALEDVSVSLITAGGTEIDGLPAEQAVIYIRPASGAPSISVNTTLILADVFVFLHLEIERDRNAQRALFDQGEEALQKHILSLIQIDGLDT